jgi:outer membrane receptor for ferrienterochelin and colicin
MAVAIALALSNLPATVFAADDDTKKKMRMVVTATGLARNDAKHRTISVVDEKGLNTRSNQNVTEALHEMPGVLTGNSSVTGFGIR